MTLIICRSACLASELAGIAGSNEVLFYGTREPGSAIQEKRADPDEVDPECERWLRERLLSGTVSLVLYESRFFVDPAAFRALSPATRFVVIGAPGDEQNTREALACGAAGAIEKPVDFGNARGVLALAVQ
jgi:hypothetical protein